MISYFKKTIIALIVFMLLTINVKAYYDLGRPTGFVNDQANVLSVEQKQLLEEKLSQFEKDTSNEIAVAIIDNLQDNTIENFAVELFKNWGIGKKDKDNGVLILIAIQDKKIKIEVGYGLEGALTDAQSNWIINQNMKPAFRENNFYQGINDAIDKIISATQGEYIPTDNSNTSNDIDLQTIYFFGFFGLMWLSSILGRSKSWWLGGVIGGVIGVIVGLLKGFMFFGLASMVILILIGLLFDYTVSKQYTKSVSRGRRAPWWIGGGGIGGGGGGGDFGGFGGFGGGGSGGGGSSGSW